MVWLKLQLRTTTRAVNMGDDVASKVSNSAIGQFLPNDPVKTKLAQAQLPEDLHDAVRKQIAKDQKAKIRIDWNVLFASACRAYLTERGAKNVP